MGKEIHPKLSGVVFFFPWPSLLLLWKVSLPLEGFILPFTLCSALPVAETQDSAKLNIIIHGLERQYCPGGEEFNIYLKETRT